MATNQAAPKAAQISPEGIDAMIIQLRSAMKFMDGIPEKVKETGTAFCEALDEWSEDLKKRGK